MKSKLMIALGPTLHKGWAHLVLVSVHATRTVCESRLTTRMSLRQSVLMFRRANRGMNASVGMEHHRFV